MMDMLGRLWVVTSRCQTHLCSRYYFPWFLHQCNSISAHVLPVRSPDKGGLASRSASNHHNFVICSHMDPRLGSMYLFLVYGGRKIRRRFLHQYTNTCTKTAYYKSQEPYLNLQFLKSKHLEKWHTTKINQNYHTQERDLTSFRKLNAVKCVS